MYLETTPAAHPGNTNMSGVTVAAGTQLTFADIVKECAVGNPDDPRRPPVCAAAAAPSGRRQPENENGNSDTSEKRNNVCPECGGTITHDTRRGEAYCADCGLVVDDEMLIHYGSVYVNGVPEEVARWV